MPSSVTTLMKTSSRVHILLASRHAAPSPSSWIFFEKVVMNAVESAPSAKRSRRRFGARNAAMNASLAVPAPKSAAKICSRANPSTRLHITASPTIPAARVLPPLLAGTSRAGPSSVAAAGADAGGSADRPGLGKLDTPGDCQNIACRATRRATSTKAAGYEPFFLQLPLLPGVLPGTCS